MVGSHAAAANGVLMLMFDLVLLTGLSAGLLLHSDPPLTSIEGDPLLLWTFKRRENSAKITVR